MSLIFPLLFKISLLSSFTHAENILTQTVGTSAFQIVTSREVKATELMGQALEKETKIKEPSIEISKDSVWRTLFEIAIYRESQNLSAVKPNAADTDALVSTIKNYLQKNPEWKKLDVTDAELKGWVERKKVASEYLKLKSASLTAIVTDQEIQDYYEKNRVKFGSTPLAEQKNNIRYFLQKESQQQRIQEWLTALKTKYQIKNDLVESDADSTLKSHLKKKPESK
jgi:hypothetical protein